MANIKSSKKRVLRSRAQALVNGNRIGRVRTFVKKVELALAAGDAAQAQEAFKNAQPEIMRGAQKGVLHANTAARTLSRLNARVKALAA